MFTGLFLDRKPTHLTDGDMVIFSFDDRTVKFVRGVSSLKNRMDDDKILLNFTFGFKETGDLVTLISTIAGLDARRLEERDATVTYQLYQRG